MFTLDSTRSAFFELVKIAIGTSDFSYDFSQLSDECWRDLMIESEQQAVTLLCFDALKNISTDIPCEIYNEWFKKTLTIVKSGVQLFCSQKQLVSALEDKKIPYVILKGYSSALYYPDAEKRTFGDIDFIVESDNIDTVKKLLIDNGYEMKPDVYDIHLSFSRNKTCIELHRKISGIPDGNVGKIFQEFLSEIVSSGVKDDNTGFRCPCASHHSIVIFLHSIHHMLSYGMGIRHLCDWACFVQKTQNESFWQEKIIPLCKETGTYKFLIALTEACVYSLGISRPEWCFPISDNTRDTILQEIFNSGNFGRKSAHDSGMMLMTAKNSEKTNAFTKMRVMVQNLNMSNKTVYPVLNKYPLLYPFIMLWRMLRYLFLMMIGKRESFSKLSSFADKKSSVYVQYELFQPDTD